MSQTQIYFAKNYGGIAGWKSTMKIIDSKDVTTGTQERMILPSKKQIANRRKFQVASFCAKNILLDPEILKAYQARALKGQSAYNLALRDYITSPDISMVISMCNRIYPVETPCIAGTSF
jgi:hypothetical protein